MLRAKSVSKVLVLKIKRLRSPSRLTLPRTARVSFASLSPTRRCVSVADCRLSVTVSVGSSTHECTLSLWLPDFLQDAASGAGVAAGRDRLAVSISEVRDSGSRIRLRLFLYRNRKLIHFSGTSFVC
ncbi:uncharacterized protein G2W53_001382 [Senna tora]|uniref:Uncharacterized protein n=1 Tax=Senna tora TaxID=362788 RepID=A0A834XHU1_9FABA|nr:uncharacterized protein G2W53_001382 [Senna tora]